MTTQWGPSAATAESSTLTDGFHLLVDAMKLNGIDTIYGLVGIPITDLARLAQASGIRFIGFRHETSAGNAAAAAGFLTRRPGVCLTVSAPGFLNGLVALANATTNCFPMIQISGSSGRPLVDLQRGDYEELDQLSAARPFVKAAYRIGRAEDIGLGVARAIRAAVSGRPGGVYLDIPGAVLSQAIDAATAATTVWPVVDPAPPQLPAPSEVCGDRKHSLSADVDGQGAAAGLAPAVRRGSALAGAGPRRRGGAGWRPAELATWSWGVAAMVGRREIHPGRHRGLRVRQQPADRRADRR
jgi:hypothetical protein